MFDVDRYLAKLDYHGSPRVDAETLRELHKKHLMWVPFDNALNSERGLDIWEHVDIDVDKTFDAIIVGGRGGVCHEISGLFRTLLRKLGFDVTIMSAGVRMANGSFGPELEHMLHVVRVDGEQWLVDVGFAGPSFLEPLRLVDDVVQEQYGCQYRITDDGEFKLLHRKAKQGDWQVVYRFRMKARDLSEWRGEPSLREYARELSAAETLIRGRAFATGQMTLIGRRYTRVDNGYEQVRVLVKPDEYQQVVDEILMTRREGGA